MREDTAKTVRRLHFRRLFTTQQFAACSVVRSKHHRIKALCAVQATIPDFTGDCASDKPPLRLKQAVLRLGSAVHLWTIDHVQERLTRACCASSSGESPDSNHSQPFPLRTTRPLTRVGRLLLKVHRKFIIIMDVIPLVVIGRTGPPHLRLVFSALVDL